MSEARGIVSGEVLENFNEATVMLLNDTNDETVSGGGMATGSGEYEWVLRWDATGFTGYDWATMTSWSEMADATYSGGFAQLYTDGKLESWLQTNNRGANMSNAMTQYPLLTESGCGGLVAI